MIQMSTSEDELTTGVAGGRDSTDTGPIPVAHPVLDVPVEDAHLTRSRGIDWIVFGVTAVIAMAFLSWGFVSTDTLASASSTALTWVMDKTGWLFVLTSTGFVVFVLYLALGRYGTIPLGRDDEPPESLARDARG